MQNRTNYAIMSMLALIVIQVQAMAQGTMLLRQPTVSDNAIVFVHADDLWSAGLNGGEARRLTSAMGTEANPRFSPDGKWIAFSGQYDGNTDVYIIPATGGDPKRLTWHPGADLVQDWTPDGKYVIFTSAREAVPTQISKFFKVAISGGTPESLSLPFAFTGSMSADGANVAYQPYPLWDVEWRNYRGGQANPIWITNLKTMETAMTTQGNGERHTSPVWHNGIVYFLSEQDYANNIWSYDPKTKTQKQVTFHKDFDVKNLAAGNGFLVYEQGGYLHKLDLSSGQTKQLDIDVRGDLNWGRPRWNNVQPQALGNASLSPTGMRALFETRGEIFTVPKEKGDWRNITNSTGAADRYPAWSPDGQKIAWFTDESGEYQLAVTDQYGLNKKTYAIANKKFYFNPRWSPDSKKIAFTDTDYNLWVFDLATGTGKIVATDRLAHPNRTLQPQWAPDSRWIAYTQIMPNQFKAIKVYNLETGATNQITDGLSDALEPQWDPTGKYLFFLASTDYALSTGWLDMSSFDRPVTRALYIAVLDKKNPSPFEPKSDEEPNAAKKDSAKSEKPAAGTPKVNIDFENISQRIVAVNVPARNYTSVLAAPEDFIFYTESLQNQPGEVLHRYSLKEQKDVEFAKGVQNIATSFDRKNMLFQMGNSWQIVPTAAAPPKPGDGKLAVESMKVYVDPQKEAEQIFREGWRFQRDFLYVENVHGAPWNDIYNWYKPWIAHVKHRSDLNYIMDILGGEVSVGHSFTSGGDFPSVPSIPVGLLGADYEVANGRYRFKKIYTGENWNPELKSPLSGPGVNVKEGEYLLEVDGKPLTADMNLYSVFEGTANRQVRIKVNDKPSDDGARMVTVVPVSNEGGLRSRAWVEDNRRKVDQLSGGKLAYVYVPNTGGAGYTYFNRYYFAQQDKQGAVIDERNNGGGSAADYMIDVMTRKLQGYFNNRVAGHAVSTTPMAGIWGPKVMIINENAGSGGDLLPYMFKQMKIGPLVGRRTWGGLVGIWDTPGFIDGGRMTAPRGGFFDVNGEWAVEGTGVAPDVEVYQDPKAVAAGQDPQLEKAVEEALRLLKTQGVQLKKEPAPPVRYRRPAE
ncbi:MAG: S41 family peptidase [Flavisolibacter sp.]